MEPPLLPTTIPSSYPLSGPLSLSLRALRHCSRLTSRLQKWHFRSNNTTVTKPDSSPVTTADFAVQALLTACMHRAFPADRFLAEEDSDALRRDGGLLTAVWELIGSVRAEWELDGLYAPVSREEVVELIDLGGRNEESAGGDGGEAAAGGGGRRRTWVFDPIDGTAAFVRGGQYAINCALLDGRGREEMGLIACPNLDPARDWVEGDVGGRAGDEEGRSTGREDEEEDSTMANAATNTTAAGDEDGKGCIVFALRGSGTWVSRLTTGRDYEAPTPILSRGPTAVSSLTFTDCSDYTSTILPYHRAVAAKLGIAWPGIDLYSSLMKYAVLGLGLGSVCIRIFKFASWRSNIWDHAGGVLIFEEVGGKVTDLEGRVINFGRGRKMADNYGLVCAPASVHGEVLRTVQEVLKANDPIPWSKERRDRE